MKNLKNMISKKECKKLLESYYKKIIKKSESLKSEQY
jgi:hypothetical protein